MSKRIDPVARHALVWFFLAQWASVLPLVSYLPVWLLLLGAGVTLWRWQIHRGAWSYPPRWIKHTITLLVPVGLILSFGLSVAMETMLSLLVAGFILKLLELRRHSDLTLLCFLGYFVASTQFLFVESIVGAGYGLICLMAVTATLLAANQSARSYHWAGVLRLTTVLLLQAIPIMLVLFFVVPRFGSLWTVPLNNTAAKTGVSDEMAPGDFSNLMRSDELAFRATFDGEVPPSSQLYWRALVLSEFDGRRWKVSSRHSPHSIRYRFENTNWADAIEVQGEASRYEVMIEPTQKEWLYVLPGIQEVSAGSGTNLYIGPGFTAFQRRPITQRFQYTASSYLQHQAQAESLPDEERRLALALPDQSNPQTYATARRWREEVDSDEALIERLLGHFRQHFRYTLQPPLLGQHTVDEFLWEIQAGFCEHFSGSFVFFLRAAGIPARVVVGYQGGKLNTDENYLTVRQYDAHAWAEVWLQGRGWVRVDPTAAVAPERIERGVEFSLSDSDSRLLGNALGRRLAWLGRLQSEWEVLNYRWNAWILSYDAEAQEAFLNRWTGNMRPWQLALMLMGIGLGFLLLLFAWSLWRQRKPPLAPVDKAYRRFLLKLSRAGIRPLAGESVRHFCRRAAAEQPDSARAIRQIGELYEKSSFASDQSALLPLQRAVRSLRIKPL